MENKMKVWSIVQKGWREGTVVSMPLALPSASPSPPASRLSPPFSENKLLAEKKTVKTGTKACSKFTSPFLKCSGSSKLLNKAKGKEAVAGRA
jgi:hypothetical protein